MITAKIEVEIVATRFRLFVKIKISDVVPTYSVVSKVKRFVLFLDLFLSLGLFFDNLHPLQLIGLSSHFGKLHDSFHLGIHAVIFYAVVFQLRLVLLLLRSILVRIIASRRLRILLFSTVRP